MHLCKPLLNRIQMERYKIAVAGTGYVGMSLATLLAQHNDVTAVDVVPERVDLVTEGIIKRYLCSKTFEKVLLKLNIRSKTNNLNQGIRNLICKCRLQILILYIFSHVM